MGNRYLRKLLVVGAHAVLYHRKPHTDALRTWTKRLIEKKPFKLVAVAFANKLARIAFALMSRKTNLSRDSGLTRRVRIAAAAENAPSGKPSEGDQEVMRRKADRSRKPGGAVCASKARYGD